MARAQAYVAGHPLDYIADGVGSSNPYEVGFIFTKTAPEINLRVASASKLFYERFGVRRSVDPDGPQADWGRAFLCVSRGARRLSLQSAQLHHQSHSGAETAAGFDVDEFVVVFLLRVWGGALVADAGIASQPTCAKWKTALSDTCRYSAGNAG